MIIRMSLLGLAAFLATMTGFRGQTMGLMFVVFVWLIYDSKNRKQTFFALLGIGFVGWLAAIALLPNLPESTQRSLSFLPLAKERIADPLLLRSAQASIDWRVEVWKVAWANVPRYLLVGRGLTFAVTGWSWLQGSAYASTDFNYANHNYHSGPLSLLVDYGLPGFICGTGFMITIVVQAWRGVKRFCAGRNDLPSRYYVFLTVQLTWAVVAYFFIFGHASESIPVMVLSAALLFIFRREFLRIESVQYSAGAGMTSPDQQHSQRTNSLLRNRRRG
jgi:hypothetical protein